MCMNAFDKITSFIGVKEEKKDAVLVASLAILTIGFYLPAIISFPYFYADDFYVLAQLKNSFVISLSEIKKVFYFVGLRPLSAFSLSLDYHLWGMNAIYYKFESLVLHAATICVFYFLVRIVLLEYTGKPNRTIQFLFSLLLAVHSDLFWGVVWIADRTEVLMLFFYVLLLLLTFRFLQTRRTLYYVGMLIAFLAAVLSKEQPLHFPVLFIILLLLHEWRAGIRIDVKKALLLAAPFLIIAIFYTAIHQTYAFYTTTFQILLRKPLAFIGTLLYCIFPLAAGPIYYFFYHHFILSLVILAIVVGVIFAVSLRSWRSVMPYAISLLIVLVAFVPRIFNWSGGRINSLQIAVLILLMALWLGTKTRKKTMAAAVVSLFILSHAIASQYYVQVLKEDFFNRRKEIEPVLALCKSFPSKNYFLLVSPDRDQITLPYELYYEMYGSFGMMRNINFSGMEFISKFDDAGKKVNVQKEKNRWIVQSLRYDTRLDTIRYPYWKKFTQIKKMIPHSSGIGSQEIDFDLVGVPKGSTLLYTDGEKWYHKDME